MHILNTSAKGGVLYESDAFANPRKALEDWAKPDAAIEMKKGALVQGAVEERVAKNYPQGLDRIMEFIWTNLPQTSGINMELLGLVERDQPGVLEAQRKKAGYAILAIFFDSLRRYRKMKGRVRLYFIQNYISDGRLIRIKGKDSTQQYVPLVRQKDTATYDVIVDEAPMSPNQKEAVWGMMTAMMPMLTKLPVPPEVWGIMLEYSPLPSSVSAKINQAINQAAQQPPPPDPEIIKVQAQLEADKQAAQLDAQTVMQKAEIEQQQAAAEMEHKREMFELERAGKILDLQVQREKADLERQKAAMSLQAKQQSDDITIETMRRKSAAASEQRSAAQ